MIKEIKKRFDELKDEKYKEFSSKLIPNIKNVLGIRLPYLRKLAKEIYKNNQIFDYLKENDDEFFELTMLEGMVIGYIDDYQTAIKYIENFIKKINNWSVCDSFCCGLKIIKKNKEHFKNFIEKYFISNKEYELRFAYVILLNYYIESDFDYVLDKILKFNNETYYSKMAVSWLLSYCFIKDFNKTLDFIKNNKINDFVLRKGITKTKESYRISKEEKNILGNFFR